MQDLSGKVFGKLLVLKKTAESRPVGIRRRISRKYLCRCECGNEVEIFSSNLTRGNSTRCVKCAASLPKYNSVDLTGKTFGKLTVIRRSEAITKTRGILWYCKCECGRETEIPTNGLTSGNNKTCRNPVHRTSERVGELPLSHYNAIKQNAIKRNLSFTVTPDELWKLFLDQDRKCALSGVPLCFTKGQDAKITRAETTASLDRIDNKKGYDIDNVRWTHKDVNRIKWKCSDEEFLEWCRLCIVHKNKNRIPDWDEWFFNQCEVIKTKSKDKHTKCGSVVVSSDNRVISQGYNSLPAGANDSVQTRFERPLKYKYMVHSERNAVYSAARIGINLKGAKIYVTGIPCMDCAHAIIQSGIIEVIYDADLQEKWSSPVYQDAGLVKELFDECNVTLRPWYRSNPK